MRETTEFEVTDELYEISEATNSDGTVDVDIYDFEKTNSENVRVYFHTPTMEKKAEVMEWPKKDSVEYKFVRLCRKTVGGLNGAEWLKSDGATIKADPDGWKIDAELSRTGKIRQRISNLTVKKLALIAGYTNFAGWLIGLKLLLVGLPIYGVLTMLGFVPILSGSVTVLSVWVVSLILLSLTFVISDDV